MRIISLVPNATEILFALGAGDRVVGVSHECDFPPEAAKLPQLTGSALAPDLDSASVDRAVSVPEHEELTTGGVTNFEIKYRREGRSIHGFAWRRTG